jgi:hypothetical protein
VESRSSIKQRRPPSAEILRRAHERRERFLEKRRGTDELRQAKAATPEEVRRCEELIEEILARLGVSAELQELRDLDRARESYGVPW